MTEDRTSTNGKPVVSFYPSEPEHLAEAAVEAGCAVGALNGTSRGLVITGKVAAEELSRLLSEHPGVEWVQLPSAGIEAFLPAVQSEAGARLTWTSAKGAYAQPVAEHAVGLSIALLRILHRRARTSSWSTVPEGKSLAGLDVAVVGAGGIGVEIIRLLNAFGANATAVRKKPEPVPGAVRTVSTDQLAEVLSTAELVILAAALTDSTSGLIGKAEFDAMKPGVNLVNIARGGLIDTDALLDALRSGKVAGAALDVTDPEPLPDGHPLWAEPGVLITPHSADTPEMIAPLLAQRVKANAEALRAGGEFVGVVDVAAGY